MVGEVLAVEIGVELPRLRIVGESSAIWPDDLAVDLQDPSPKRFAAPALDLAAWTLAVRHRLLRLCEAFESVTGSGFQD